MYQVISVHDCDSLYRVPVLLAEQNVVALLKERLGLDAITLPFESQSALKIWHELAER
jgi:CTP synthase (UTP-ammonia lyase)